MNLERTLLGGFVISALAIGCGSDSKGNGNESSSSNLAACGSNNPTGDCATCAQTKCGAALTKCFGENYSGGICADYVACASKAADPCKPQGCASPSGDCLACITNDLSGCELENCHAECVGGGGPPGGGGSNVGGFGGSSMGGFGGSGAFGGSSIGGTGNIGNTGGPNCATLSACCGRITNPDIRSGCEDSYSQAAGDESLCRVIYDAVVDFCP
jgi:hypothetical protein